MSLPLRDTYRPLRSLFGAIVAAFLLAGCGESGPAPGTTVKAIPTVNPTPDNPNIPVEDEYKHMEKLKKGNAAK